MTEGGETLDLKRIRLTVAQFVTLFLLLIGAVTGAAMTTFTTQETAREVGEMRVEIKAVARAVNSLKTSNAVFDSRIGAIEDRLPGRSRRTIRRDTTQEDE